MDEGNARTNIFENISMHDRMFRHKPYTSCLQCLNDTRLRCKKCMDTMMDQIGKRNQVKGKTLTGCFTHHGSPTKKAEAKKLRISKSIGKKENKFQREQFVLTNKYDMWMVTTKEKRQKNRTMNQWPRKIRLNDRYLEKHGIKQPKFEKWQKKLIDQLMEKASK